MGALSANATHTFYPCGEAKWDSGVPGDEDKYYPEVASAATIYKGAVLVYNAAGYVQPNDSQAANTRVAGIALEAVDNSSGTNGDVTVQTLRSKVIIDANSVTGASQANEGAPVYIGSTDNTTDFTMTQSNNCPQVGWLLQDQTTIAFTGGAVVFDPQLSNFDTEAVSYWDRSGSTLTPATTNDNVDIGTGDIDCQHVTATGTVSGANLSISSHGACATFAITTVGSAAPSLTNAGELRLYTSGGNCYLAGSPDGTDIYAVQLDISL